MHFRLAAGWVLLALACLPAAATADQPVTLSAAFGSGARLGGQAPLHMGLDIDVGRVPFRATEIRLLAPAGIDIGGLGVATCRIAPATLVDVLLSRNPEVPCPRNAVIGSGTATAALLFDPEEPAIQGDADITLYSGVPLDARPGLLVVARTSNPVATQLAYAGRLSPAARPFGLELAVDVREPKEPPFGADIALTRMRVTIGGNGLVYTRPIPGGRAYYRPGGVGLPSRCPRGGLRFRAGLRFSDGSQRAAETRVPCPPPMGRRDGRR